MRPVTLGLLALFALAASGGAAFAERAGHMVKTTTPTTDGSMPITVPTARDDG